MKRFFNPGVFITTLALLFSAPARAAGTVAEKAFRAPVTPFWQTSRKPPTATLVFLHGLGDSPDTPIIQRLVGALGREGASVEIIAPWLRPVTVDAGGIVSPAGVQTMSYQLNEARRAIRATNGQVVLVGHSFGGKAALALAKEFPGKVKGVVALAPSVKMLYSYWKGLTGERGLPDAARIGRVLGEQRTALQQQLAKADKPQLVRQIKSELGYLDVMRDLARYDEPGLERGVTTPTLVLHGTEDAAV